jgi:hypothetical protein
MSKKCIFITVFMNEHYIKLLFMLLESIYLFGNLDEYTDILIYTSTNFMEIISKSNFYSDKIKFEINDDYNDLYNSCRARLDLFNLKLVENYKKILYLDTDILIKGEINKVFDLANEDLLYALSEGQIYHESNSWGRILFGDEVFNYSDPSAFTSGILLFNNCEKIKFLFDKINEDMINRPESYFDQPYIVYNSFKYGLYNNKVLGTCVANHDYGCFNHIVVDHFPGGPGDPSQKLLIMKDYLEYLKRISNK